ncbi:oligosaccharide flippase family protein [bacterium]|nr:oligosaccharide flippase family protein [bacterium]
MKLRSSWPLSELAFVWGGNILSKVMMFFATIYLANRLEVEGFGIFSTAFAVTNYISLALFTGLDSLTTRESAKLSPETVWPFAKELFHVRRKLANLAVILTALIALYMGKESRDAGFALILFGLGFIPLQFYTVNLFYGLEWSWPIAAYFVGGRLVYLALLFILVKGSSNLMAAAGAFTAAIAIENIFLFLCLFLRYGKISDRSRPAPKINIRPVLLLTLASALILLHENAPQFLIFFLKGEEEAGLYASSFRLIYTAVTFANLGGFVFLARFSKETGEGTYKRSLLPALVLGLLFAVAGYFFAELIYSFLFSQSYAGGALVLKAGIFQMALVPLRVLAWQRVIAKEKVKSALLPLILGVLFSIGISTYMICATGAVGAARGLFCGEAAITALMLILAK